MAGIDLTGNRRSQLLEMLLQQQNQRPQVQSGVELAARLGAQLIRQKQIKKLQGEEKASQQELVEALQAGQATGPNAVTLEDFEGGSGREQVTIPGKKADRFAQQEALSKLSPEQQLQAMQLQGIKRELAEPTKSQQATTEFDRRRELQAQSEAASMEQTKLRIESAEDRLTRQIAAEEKIVGRKLDADELKQIRGIQADVDLLDKKINAEIEAASATGGDFKSSQWIAAGYGVRAEDAAKTIDEVGGDFTGIVSRGVGVVPQGWRLKDRQRFNQAKRNFINAQLRRESGAVISEQEFANADLQYFPQPGDKAGVLKEKKRNRSVVVNALRGEAAGAYDALKARLGSTPDNTGGGSSTPTYTEGQTASDGQGNTVVYRGGEWVPQ